MLKRAIPDQDMSSGSDSDSDNEDQDFAAPEAQCVECRCWICMDCGYPEGDNCMCEAAESDCVEYGSDDEGLCRSCQIELDGSSDGEPESEMDPV